MELRHYGIKGMKWGVRRTPEQLARASGNSRSERRKEAKSMSDAELKSKINRLNMEKQYVDLTAGKSDNDKVKKGAEIVGKLAGNMAKQLITQQVVSRANNKINRKFTDRNK